ncbi:pre-rRNA-processing protein esf2-like [Contarinia nasturtii]|uniref:pre-rRNA-processing protein esf2-like n=1 Tax=Contarinia nasturtii TaxID=265458 RepID=UPI0012D4A021|nr:pre-rRNA-processing protein esf2-like [Contarinia nasturtii]
MQKKNEKMVASDSESEADEDLSNDEEMSDENGKNDSENEDEEAGPSDKPEKKKKRGIIYISSIPKYMNVTILREMLGEYAKIGRVFLQPGKLSAEEENRKKKKRRVARHFTEGWVEFESKRAAKRVVQMLNNAPIASRKSSKFYDKFWVMKYLPRFKWVHLSERLTYEKAVHRQKLQSEISQARKETAFFQENLDKSAKFKKLKKKQKKSNNFVETDAS